MSEVGAAAFDHVAKHYRLRPNLPHGLVKLYESFVYWLTQKRSGPTVDGIVGLATWAVLPNGGPMPTLQDGSTGAVVNSLQTLLTNGAPGQWNTTPPGIDGNFGPHTRASLVAFQAWGGVAQDGAVGDQAWAVSLHATSATLEAAVGLQFVVN